VHGLGWMAHEVDQVQNGVTMMWCMGWGMCKTWDSGLTHVCGRVKTCANGGFSMHSTCTPQVALLRYSVMVFAI
jgi:hypothetical protein